ASVALLLLLVGKLDVKLFAVASERAADLVAAVAAWPAAPLGALRRGAETLGSLFALVEENRRLREENRRLVHWQNEAVRLAVQNAALREALRIPEVPGARRHTVARVVADPGSPFVQTRLIDAGRDRGIEKGMPVVDSYGLVGRVVEVGERSARVLLLTDFNSKIPVVVADSRDQAILEGRNGPLAELRFLPMDPSVKVGDRVLTSGRGGLLPPGLPVGEIVQIDERRVLVRPHVDWDRLDWVSVLATEPVPAPSGQIPTVEAVPAPMRAAGLPAR
ncbi:MAG: rod shape-determining protein MreC, partial [Geminicoccaceae bacterium]|nr:rod shape-determining protein MreC [Geminicoccaceae bacterium]